MNRPVRIIQLTDTHLFAHEQGELMGLETAKSLQSVLSEVANLPFQPDVLLLTGDLSQDETAESYQRFWQMISPLGIPTYSIPGNHDISPLLETILQPAPFSPDRAFRLGSWAIVLLDSTVSDCVYGEFSNDRLDWLSQQLTRFADCPTLVALHHPPAAIGSEWMDDISLQNPDTFYAVIDRYPQVKAVIFGHIHQAFDGERNGVRYLGAPSTGIQFKPRSREMAIDEEQPGFRILTLHDDGQLETEVKRVALRISFT